MEGGARRAAPRRRHCAARHSLRAALRYAMDTCTGSTARPPSRGGQSAQAQQEFTDAVVAFREAASLRSEWPDPFLGLARTFIYGLEDVDRGADALAQAEKRGHPPGERETTQIADGYRARGETLARTAQTLKGMPQERDYLIARGRCLPSGARRGTRRSSGFGNAARNIRETQQRLDRVEQRCKRASNGGGGRGTDVSRTVAIVARRHARIGLVHARRTSSDVDVAGRRRRRRAGVRRSHSRRGVTARGWPTGRLE